MHKDIFVAGDWVVYTLKDEIGLVKSTALPGDVVHVWYHTGGTSAATPRDFIRRIDRPQALVRYSNSYALPSLEERRVRLLSGVGDIGDLIEGKDVRAQIRRRYGE